MNGLSATVVRVLRSPPLRACFLWLGARFESLVRTYFFLKTRLLPPGTGVRHGLHQSIVEDGLEAATPEQREAILDEVVRVGDAAENERLARWAGRRVVESRDDAALLAFVEDGLVRSTPARKQRFYAWLEERAALDEHSLEYAERIFAWLRREIEARRGSIRGLRILELGPGHTLVPGVLFYVHGAASYTAVDMFPIAGKDSALYRRLRAHLAKPAASPAPAADALADALRRFDEVVSLEGPEVVLDESKVSCRCPVDAAKLPFPDASFDVVTSNAAFEHFADPAAAVRECTRVLAADGLGLHQIDLRDHRDFEKPLDFLRYEDEEWRRLHANLFCYTNRFRKSDFERAFAESGLEVAAVDVNLKAPFDPALRAQFHPRFRDRSVDDLEALSAFFVLKKPAAVLVS
jgi:SAM-dependent methyltransferase